MEVNSSYNREIFFAPVEEEYEKNLLFLSAAKPRPWNSRCCCCCSSSSWGDYFGFRFFSRYGNLYKITFVDNNKVTNPTNFQPVVTSTFAKKAKNDFAFFCNFAVF